MRISADVEVRGVEAHFLCLFNDYSVSYVQYRIILHFHHELYMNYYNYA